MATNDLPQRPHGPGDAAAQLVREWRRRIGRHGGYPSKEIPHLVDALVAVGFDVTPDFDADARRLRLEYTAPDDVPDAEGAVELLVTALLATPDAAEWAETGVYATNGDGVEWRVGRQGLKHPDAKPVVQAAVETITRDDAAEEGAG